MSEPIHSRDWFTGANADERYAAQLREAVAREEGTDQPVPAAVRPTPFDFAHKRGIDSMHHFHRRSTDLAPAPTASAGLRDRLAAEVSALVSPEMVARSSEPYAQGYINAVNYVLGILAADDRAAIASPSEEPTVRQADYDHLVEVARGLADVSEEAWGAADCGYVPNDRVRAAMKDRIAALRALIDPATRPWQDAADAEMRAAVDASAQAARTALATPEPDR